jgi:hypothetical protein
VIYKIDIKSITYKLLVIGIVFTIIVGYLLQDFSLVIFLITFTIIIGIEVIIFFLGVYLVEINIKESEDCLSLHFKKKLINNYFKEIPFNELYFSFKNETGARGIKSKELRLYNSKREKIIGIGKGFDGWKETTIQQIIQEFKVLNILEIE